MLSEFYKNYERGKVMKRCKQSAKIIVPMGKFHSMCPYYTAPKSCYAIPGGPHAYICDDNKAQDYVYCNVYELRVKEYGR